MISSAADGNRSKQRSFTVNRLVLPRRSDSTKPVSAKTFKWCDTVGWPMSTTSTSSPTVIGRRASANRFSSNTRDGSPRHRNHDAHTSADERSTFIDYRR